MGLPTHGARITGVLLCGALVTVVGCGALGPPLAAIDDNVAGEPACLDLWSLVHAATGALFAAELGDDSCGPTLAALTGFEIVEPYIWPNWNESELNQDCDIVVGMAGWLVQSAAD